MNFMRPNISTGTRKGWGGDIRRRIAMISHCFRNGSNLEALRLFRQMQYDGLPPNRFILPGLLRSASNLSDTSTGRFLHSLAIRSLLTPDAFISSALIEFYSKHGRIKDARHVFDETPEKDLVVWNSMVSGYACCNGLLEEATSLFRKMQSCGPKPDLLTWNSLISGFSQSGYEQKALELLDSMRAAGIEADVFSWTSLISGSVRNFNYGRAFLFFRQMVGVAGISPNATTISSLLPAPANVMNLRRGREIHGFSVVAGVERDLFVSTALVDMYGKCGVIFDAEKVFDHMPGRNTISWNSMVFAYANHGCCKKAIQLFNQMEIYGATPDHLTFTAVLAACSHTGMVQLGNHFFWLMQEGHGIAPMLEHYACMVDLLGRAGKVFEAYDLISGMPMEPDFFVWGALLGACRLHINVKLSKIAARHLNELEPKSAASCLLLSSVLMNCGMLEDAEKIKKLLKKRKSTRYVGCSWTQAAASLRLCE
ncbi:Pentatricopeptide repeat-containing protein [Platanthera guangdongensis]|uniref:Pentatricopeptide repeat-containing protein n=1 Tax=Platanthera guangdongensis TaxID=2320717 RepID=A0ABR2LWA1_9ASPA